MHETTLNAPAAQVALAAAGPTLLGACLTLAGDASNPGAVTGTGVIAFPAIVLGVTLATAPALFVAGAYLGVVDDARSFARATLSSLGDAGLAMIGLAAPLLFLVASTGGADTQVLFAALALGAGVIFGLRSFLARTLSTPVRPRSVLLFVAWSAVALALGFYFLAKATTERGVL